MGPLFALPFACIGNCAEIMNFIMRTHPLHFTTSSTSLSWHIRLSWQNETAALAEGVECDSWRRHICTLLHKDSTLTVLNIQSRCYSTNNLPPLMSHRFAIAYSLALLSSHLQYMYHSLDASQVLCHVTYGKHQSHRISVMLCRLIYVTYQLVALWYERFYSIIRNPT